MASAPIPDPASADLRPFLLQVIEHLDHLLPGQAPILNFVHHNTLHGYQHLDFTAALAEAERRTGIRGYLAEDEFRRLYAAGRIDAADLAESLSAHGGSTADRDPLKETGLAVSHRELDRLSLVYGFRGLTPAQHAWQMAESAAFTRLQPDLPAAVRDEALQQGCEAERVAGLWYACQESLGIPVAARPDAGVLAEAEVAAAENLTAEFGPPLQRLTDDLCRIRPDLHHRVRHAAQQRLEKMLAEVGDGATLRELLRRLSGHDLLERIRPALIRYCSSHLDEGLAAWRSPDRGEGLFAAWRRCAPLDIGREPADLPRQRALLRQLPGQPLDAIIHCLQRMGLAPSHWPGYLERAVLEIPGWAGMINWRQHHPEYRANRESPVRLTDFLALRLTLEALAAERLCGETWGIDASLPALRRYFTANQSELYVRDALSSGTLPEYLTQEIQHLAQLGWTERHHHQEWRSLADTLAAWRESAAGNGTHTAHGSGWRWFRLAQHLGLDGAAVRRLTRVQVEALLQGVDRLSPQQRGFIWLCAYERHYRNQVFAALAANQGRWRSPGRRPPAQVVFCMDDREESIRRHLEEINPDLVTFGAAGFFGVPMNWRGLDDTEVTPLCPVVVTPAHEVLERAAEGADGRPRQRGRWLAGRLSRLFHQGLRRHLLSSLVLIDVAAPAVLLNLAAKIIDPLWQARATDRVRRALVPELATRLHLDAPADSPAATPERPRLGFTDPEQADRVTAFLRIIGLTSGFAPLVVIAGHGSQSQNNPHLAAYDCGACSGRHGGPNARAFAAMANRPAVRELVARRGIEIPADTWFLGSEHNTCDEDWLWFDRDLLPAALDGPLQALQADLTEALQRSAHERCRRLASAPRDPVGTTALRHMQARATDFSQARPELGHATNAAALIGRRAVTRGCFLDRRVFLISYDPTIDADGTILEGILLAAGPVGAGINLEYYFSTVDNDRFGCGTKVPHNVTGLFAVMEGSCSDLRTGLPRQMIEIHEAMRLQVIVEARRETLTAIYQRQPPLRELIGNGWILLSAVDPDSGALSVFEPEHGFRPWQPDPAELPRVARSADWYRGHSGPLPPALIDPGPEVGHGR